jgi:hypothetical protein
MMARSGLLAFERRRRGRAYSRCCRPALAIDCRSDGAILAETVVEIGAVIDTAAGTALTSSAGRFALIVDDSELVVYHL